MTAKTCADIKPTGLNQKDLVDLMYDLTASLRGVAIKLDVDDAVVSTYVSGGITAVFNCAIKDSAGNYLDLTQSGESSTVAPTYIITPYGLTEEALLEWMYQWVYGLNVLCETLDASAGVALTTFKANCYTAIMTDKIINRRGQSIGSGTDYTFNAVDKRGGKLVEWLYDAVNAVETFTEQLDVDGTLTDTNYEALWFTAQVPLTVENSAGSRVGN